MNGHKIVGRTWKRKGQQLLTEVDVEELCEVHMRNPVGL